MKHLRRAFPFPTASAYPIPRPVIGPLPAQLCQARKSALSPPDTLPRVAAIRASSSAATIGVRRCFSPWASWRQAFLNFATYAGGCRPIRCTQLSGMALSGLPDFHALYSASSAGWSPHVGLERDPGNMSSRTAHFILSSPRQLSTCHLAQKAMSGVLYSE